MEHTFQRFYEEVLIMAREGVPAEVIERKIRQHVPDPGSLKQLLGHLRDSRDAFEAEGDETATATLDEVIELLEHSEESCE